VCAETFWVAPSTLPNPTLPYPTRIRWHTMGNLLCGTKATKEELEAIKQSRGVDRALATSRLKEKKTIKLLLLGTGESGKSTIFKQMQILYDSGFTEIDQTVFKGVLRSNVVEAMQTLIQGMEVFELEFKSNSADDSAQYIEELEYLNTDFWEEEIVEHVQKLWGDAMIQEVYRNRAKLQLLDSTKYFFENIDRIGANGYVPNTMDILRARLRTSGIVEKTFLVHEQVFRFLDVGGQRNERKKWLHCFDNVTSIMFVAAISEYDQVLFEEDSINRLRESIAVWGKIANEDCFKKTAMILFLNKIDLFKEKLETVMLNDHFSDFTGENTFQDASEYIQETFLEALQNRDEQMIFCHFTQATDTDHFDKVFEACKHVILRGNLEDIGLQ